MVSICILKPPVQVENVRVLKNFKFKSLKQINK